MPTPSRGHGTQFGTDDERLFAMLRGTTWNTGRSARRTLFDRYSTNCGAKKTRRRVQNVQNCFDLRGGYLISRISLCCSQEITVNVF